MRSDHTNHYAASGVYPAPVRVGGTVGARLRCDGIDCAAESSTRQNVLGPDDSATWTWVLTAHRTGTAHLDLTVTTYDGDTSDVLAAVPQAEGRAG